MARIGGCFALETRQRGFLTREFLTWFALAALCAGQIVLIYGLLS